MGRRKLIYATLVALSALLAILAAIGGFKNDQALKVVFFDVGQGDAILISQGSNQVIIDGGADPKTALEKLGRRIPFWDRHIEAVIATHPDQDHIGGLVEVLRNYKIGHVIMSPAGSDSQVFANFLKAIDEENIEKTTGQAGLELKMGEARLEIIYPGQAYKKYKDTNDGSLVVRLTYGENSFLFTGDLPEDSEAELSGDLKAKILKIAHHGSKYSTGLELLEKVKPLSAVVSVGASNRYGHPSPEIIERLKNKKIDIWRTDFHGDISYLCPKAELLCRLETEKE